MSERPSITRPSMRALLGSNGLWVLLLPGLVLAAELDDPTRPTALAPPPAVEQSTPAAAPAASPGWRLQQTLTAAGRRLAVINGVILKEGDRINGARLVQVRPGRATLELARGQRLELRLAERQVKALRPGRGER